MPVSFEHLNDLVQVWDGNTSLMMPRDEALEKAAKGKVQLTKNLSAAELKTKAELASHAKTLQRRKTRTKQQTGYKNKQMTSE